MKTTAEKIAVMQAYADGKTIQITGDEEWEDWLIDMEPGWDWDRFDYRIKPEPKYRPYNGGEECLREVQKHGGWVVDLYGDRFQITGINEARFMIGTKWHNFADAVIEFTWADDGTPCGVLEE